MKKEGIVIIFMILLVASSYLVVAQDAKVEKGYDCLKNKVDGNCDDLTVEEKAFTALAISNCVSELVDDSNDEVCWPGSSCNLRDTSLAILALSRNNKETDEAQDWLVDQTEYPKDLVWFLEIDSDQESECTVSYSGSEYSITVKDDKKLSGSGGSCLSVDSSGYWLEIDDGCYDKNFTVSCDNDFITALLYKKKSGSTIYVSSKTNFGASQGKTEEKVNSLCFGSNCDYEGSLWATLALAETGNDVSAYLPYLIAMGQDNEKYFPSAFLYIITDYDDFFAEVLDLQVNDYWKITNSPYHQFYDTALALLALQGLDSQQGSLAKSYFLSVQDENGCWRNNVRDTAFILYAAWPKSTSGSDSKIDYCEDFDFYCVSSTECSDDDIKDLPCEGSLGKVCCTQKPKEETCLDKGGEKCEGDEECDGKLIEASDTYNCCRGSCVIPTPLESECESEGYYCRSECFDDEQGSVYGCDYGEVCCEPKPEPGPSYWWIWILIILIILVVLAIVFKDRIRVFIFKLKNRSKKGPSSQGPPNRRFPPSNQQGMPMMRPMMPSRSQPPRVTRPNRVVPARKPAVKKDEELEDTLKKLKDISK